MIKETYNLVRQENIFANYLKVYSKQNKKDISKKILQNSINLYSELFLMWTYQPHLNEINPW